MGCDNKEATQHFVSGVLVHCEDKLARSHDDREVCQAIFHVSITFPVRLHTHSVTSSKVQTESRMRIFIFGLVSCIKVSLLFMQGKQSVNLNHSIRARRVDLLTHWRTSLLENKPQLCNEDEMLLGLEGAQSGSAPSPRVYSHISTLSYL